MKVTCAVAGLAVAYLGWYDTVHSFRFRNPSYAHALVAANQGKIVY